MSDALPADLHSAAYFGDQRDFWWNPDFVALCAARVGLARVRRALDVGCGVGHWSRVLLPHLPQAQLVGVDREPRWVEEATRRAAAAGWAAQTRYQVGDVAALPFDDGAFDLVTCQTVLIHLADVPAALAELRRVLAPGGTLLLAEPNNLAGATSVGSVRHAEPIATRLQLLRLHLAIERGKAALGEGDNSVGELLPGLLAQAGFGDIRCWISDRASMVLPPYASPAEQAVVRDFVDSFDQGWWGWSRGDAERYYRASGEAPADFAGLWALARAAAAQDVAALRAGQFSAAWGGVQYLFAATRPS